MPKPKAINEGGELINVPHERTPEIIEVSYTQAKKLMKKPMSDAQKLNAERLVAMNRVKWEAKKKATEDLYKKQQAQIEATTTKVLVKPKRVYPPKPTKQAPKYAPEPESEEESQESDSDVQYSAPKQPQVKVKHVEKKLQKIQEIDNKINEIKQVQPVSTYGNLLSKFWRN